jgi:hypothetical protein
MSVCLEKEVIKKGLVTTWLEEEVVIQVESNHMVHEKEVMEMVEV